MLLILTVDQLAFGFSKLPLFSHVTFALNSGEILHIEGPNGAGKSTLLQVIAGILTPQVGLISVRIGEQTISDRRMAMTYIPAEGNGLFSKQDALTNLRFWARMEGLHAPDEDLMATLARWGLTNSYFVRDFAVGKFSTGMKRRLALARLTVNNKPVWLIDEPVFGLDTEAMALFRTNLQSHIQRGGIALIVSHDHSVFNGLSPNHLAVRDFPPTIRNDA